MTEWSRLLAAAAILSGVLIPGVVHAEIVGRASVIDGDTLEIRGQRIRLSGIDAPEGNQTCSRGGQPYRCGQQAAIALADKIGQRTVSCDEQGTDRYRRTLAVCFLGNEDLGSWLVTAGWALSFRRYSLRYVAEEDNARAAQRGLWQGEFTTPWEWRAARR